MLLSFSEKNYYFSKPIHFNQLQQPAKNVNLDCFPTTQILQPEPQTTTSEKSEKKSVKLNQHHHWNARY